MKVRYILFGLLLLSFNTYGQSHKVNGVNNGINKSMVVVNGKIYEGTNVTINNGTVIIDGKRVDGGSDKIINITIDGNIESLNCDAANTITVSGTAGIIKTQSGDVKCGNVSGSVNTMSGDVNCGNVGGSVSTMSGDISKR